jgi:hypothetical protein
MGFASLQHIRKRESTGRGLCLPATVRLQGLATLVTDYSSRIPAGLVSYRRRSWDSPFGAFSSREDPTRFRSGKPTYRFSCRYTPHRGAGPARQAAVPGFLSPGSPWRPNVCLAHRPLDAPLGFTLLGYSNECLGRDFARPPLPRFSGRTKGPASGASESRWAFARPEPSLQQAADAGSSGPFRVLHQPQPEAFKPPITRAMCSPRVRRTLLPTGPRSLDD